VEKRGRIIWIALLILLVLLSLTSLVYDGHVVKLTSSSNTGSNSRSSPTVTSSSESNSGSSTVTSAIVNSPYSSLHQSFSARYSPMATTLLSFKKGVSIQDNIKTEVLYIDSRLGIKNIFVSLDIVKQGNVNAIYKCEDQDFTSNIFKCDNWIKTDIPFTIEDNKIEFRAPSFSAYGGGGELPLPETIVWIEPGTYDMDEIVTQSGTASDWIRYKANGPLGSVVIRGGAYIYDSYIILDGMYIDGGLDPKLGDATPSSRAIRVRADHVHVENSEIAGPADIHIGYDQNGNPDCSEGESYSARYGNAGAIENGNEAPGFDDFYFYNVTVHGWYGATADLYGWNKFEKCVFRNSFNGPYPARSQYFELVDSVIWDINNHILASKAPYTNSVVRNNLITMPQETLYYYVQTAGNSFEFTHNTVWDPDGRPCVTTDAMNLHELGDVIVKDNIVVIDTEGFERIFSSQIGEIESDHNMFYHFGGVWEDGREFRIDSNPMPLEEWISTTGQGQNTIVLRTAEGDSPPAFVDEPYWGEDSTWGMWTPPTREAARERFFLQPGSVGTGAASDGLDIGIVPDGLVSGDCGDGDIDIGEDCDGTDFGDYGDGQDQCDEYFGRNVY